MQKFTGFLLSYIKFGDQDAVVNFFTRESGFSTYFLRGIYTAKNKKKAYLSPLNELNCSVNSFKKTTLPAIKNLEMAKSETDLDLANIKISAILFFVADVLSTVLKNEENSDEIYDEIGVFREEISHKNYQAHLVFLVRLLKISGISPLVSDFEFLNPQTGNFSSKIEHPIFSKEISTIWKEILSSENPYQISISSHFRKDFLDSVLIYYAFHSPEFRTPKSLEVVQEVFE